MVQKLIQEIRKSGLGVGDRLPSIRQLSVKLGVKTNVVRDSLVQAQTMGLLKIYPRSGAFVQSLNFAPMVSALSDALETALLQEDHNLFHLLDARGVIEVELAAQAAVRRSLEDLLPVRQAIEEMVRHRKDPARATDADIEFHLGIARTAGNPVLETIQRALLTLLRPCIQRVKSHQPLEWRLRGERSHEAIYRAILEGDAERARAEMRDHLGLARTTLLERVQAPASPSPGDGASTTAELLRS
jgi:GntR family transcriptional repressor for pyruvate dehydrogenase complex